MSDQKPPEEAAHPLLETCRTQLSMIEKYKSLGDEKYTSAVLRMLTSTLLSDQSVDSNCKQLVLTELHRLNFVPDVVYMELMDKLLATLLEEVESGEQSLSPSCAVVCNDERLLFGTATPVPYRCLLCREFNRVDCADAGAHKAPMSLVSPGAASLSSRTTSVPPPAAAPAPAPLPVPSELAARRDLEPTPKLADLWHLLKPYTVSALLKALRCTTPLAVDLPATAVTCSVCQQPPQSTYATTDSSFCCCC